MDTLHVEAVLPVYLLHLIPYGDPVVLAPRGNFTQAHNGNNGIFVPCMRSGKASVALLKAEHVLVIMILLKPLDLLTYILESGKYLYKLYIKCGGYRICKVRRNDRLYKCRILRQCACCLSLS